VDFLASPHSISRLLCAVFKVMNTETCEQCAMKTMRITQQEAGKVTKVVESLMREIELMQDLSHPNIVRYLGSERKEDRLNIYMEYVSGGSIASMLLKFSSFPERVTVIYTRQMLQGLRYLHDKRIIHRYARFDALSRHFTDACDP
jgi:serine/threonine protein kinase